MAANTTGAASSTVPATPGKDQLLSFRAVGRPISIDGLEDELRLMAAQLKEPLTVDRVRTIAAASGTHLLKLINPRMDSARAVLRITDTDGQPRHALLPSGNAANMPYCKLLYRPLEIIDHPPSRSVIDALIARERNEASHRVAEAFATVFGADVRDALEADLQAPCEPIAQLHASEFPIIYIPRPGGGDLQVTPVSPAGAYMDVREITKPYYQKQTKDGPKVPRGRFSRQAGSARPQNICGALSGPRVRLWADLPPGLDEYDAELYRFLNGGRFPRYRAAEVQEWVLRYAELLQTTETYSDRNIRDSLADIADRLIADAQRFIDETMADATREIAGTRDTNDATEEGGDAHTAPSPPGVATVLMRRRWSSEDAYHRARWALASPDFTRRIAKHHQRSGSPA